MMWVLVLSICGWSSCEPKEFAIFPDKASCEKAGEKFDKQYYWVCGVKLLPEAKGDKS